MPSWPAGLPHEGSSEALVRHRAGALSAGLRTHEHCDRHRSPSYRSSLPRRRRPVLRDDFRSRLPLRGSPGFTPGSLFSPWDSSPTSTDSERPDTAEGRACQSERAPPLAHAVRSMPCTRSSAAAACSFVALILAHAIASFGARRIVAESHRDRRAALPRGASLRDVVLDGVASRLLRHRLPYAVGPGGLTLWESGVNPELPRSGNGE